MKKVFFSIFIFLISSVFVLSGSNFFIEGGYRGALTLNDLSYSWNWNNSYITVKENGNVNTILGSGYSFGGGIMFSNFSLSFFYLKQDLTGDSNYNLSWTWYNGKKGKSAGKWENEGYVSIIPVSLNYNFIYRLNRKNHINIYAGPSIYMIKSSLNVTIGYASVLIDNGTIYLDYYPFQLTADNSITKFGADFGLNYEFRVNYSLAFYLGAQYFYIPNINTKWSLKTGKYNGALGNLYRTVDDPNFLDDIMDTNLEMKLSFYKVHFGIRIYM